MQSLRARHINDLTTLSISGRSPCTRLIRSGLSGSHYACRSRRAFCPLLPTGSVGGSRLGRVAGGAWVAFADYTHQLVPFASGWLLTVIVWAATATEATLGVLLLTGWRPKLVGAATCLVLIIFGTAMAVSLGLESPLSYSVFSAASAAAAYAILGTTSPPHTTDTTHLVRSAPDGLEPCLRRQDYRPVQRRGPRLLWR